MFVTAVCFLFLLILEPDLTGHPGRFPFDQKLRKFRVGERMIQAFSGISFRNFGCTSRGWPKMPENRNNRKILFHSTIPTRAQFLRARKSNNMAGASCRTSLPTARAGSWLAILQRKAKTCFEGRMAARPDPFPRGIFPVGMTARVKSSRTRFQPTLLRASYAEQRYVVVLA